MERFLPHRATIEAFGNGGFRFAGMSHLGSLLILPSSMRAWNVENFDEMKPNAFDMVLAEKAKIDFLIIGAGSQMKRLPQDVSIFLSSAGFMFDCMSTSAAIHDYNVMMAENRRVAAALISVERAHDR